jgi:hypothetical protein
MGKIEKILHHDELPDRELHNSRMFVDLSENVHIHFRELRLMFGREEFFEFFSILEEGARDVKKYMRKNPDYEEQEVFEGILVGGGTDRQIIPLMKSPKPHVSKYFPNRIQIELQEEKEIDSIHVHYRDYRLVMNIATFKKVTRGMMSALGRLEKYLSENDYRETEHPFRKVVSREEWAKGKVSSEGKAKILLNKLLRRMRLLPSKGGRD